MTKRTRKKFLKIEHHEKLTPEVKEMLKNKRKQLTVKYEEEVRFIDRMLKKPTLKKEE